MDTLAGRTMFISGASRGIGLEIAKRVAADGGNVALMAKTDQPHPKLAGTIHTAAAEIEAAGGQALPIVGDIRFEDQVAAAVEPTAQRFRGRRRRRAAARHLRGGLGRLHPVVTDGPRRGYRSPLAATWTIDASTSHSTGARSSV